MASFRLVTIFKIIIALDIIFFLFYRLLYENHIGQGLRDNNKIIKYQKSKRIFLITLAALSIITFFNLGSFRRNKLNLPSYLNYWDFFHYYVGSKYFPELGYSNLYNATVVADAEDNNYLKGIGDVMNVESYHFIPREEILKDANYYKSLFSPWRWQEFISDIRFIKMSYYNAASFGEDMLRDHGYNASPAWNTTGVIISNIVPIDKIFFLSLLDILLLIIMFWVITYSFGIEIMLMSVIFFSVNYLSNFDWIGGGFLRYDWLACVVIAVCMIHKNRYKTAGALLSYATMVRLFPILFGLGIGIKATFTFIEKRLIPQKYRQFFLSFILTSVILFAYGSSYGKGIDNWVKFSQKIARHSQTLIPNNTGFKMIFLHDKGWSGFKKFLEVYGRTKENPFILLKELKKSEFDQRKGEFLLFATAALLLFFLIIKNKDDLEAFVWGFFLIFMLLYLSCYYYSFLLMFIIIFYKREINLTNTLYLVLLFLTQIAAYLIGGSYFGFRLHIFYRVSLILFIYLFYLITSELYRKFRYQGFNQSV